jgi:ribonucleoside-diphosphate reductase alpha chain
MQALAASTSLTSSENNLKEGSMLEFNRLLTQDEIDPYDAISWIRQDIISKDKDGKTTFECLNAEFPDFWGSDATNMMAKKYFRQSYTNPTARETSVRQTFTRIVSAITKAGVKQGYFNEENAKAFSAELSAILLKQLALFNSPVLFNVGVVDKPLASACFVVGIGDSMPEILEHVKTCGLTFQHGAGVGTNYSRLRGSNEAVSGGGHASGPISFMGIGDSAAAVILSGGRTRRAAMMSVLDVDHPNIEEFIQIKSKQEDLVQLLVEAGLSPRFDDPEGAYSIAKMQNQNNSVRVTDAFMQRVREVLHGYKDSHTWDLINRVDGAIAKTVSITDLFQTIAAAAWKCGDPGIQFHTTVNKMNTVANDGEIRGSNPCGEIVFLDDTACNLASLNLEKYLLPDHNFDIKLFKHVIRLVLIAQDILIEHSSYPTPLIEANSHKYRPLGLGPTNLGGMLMALGLPYDSEDGRNLAASILSLMTGHAYAVSAELATVKGPFVRFEANKESMENVLGRHVNATRALKKDIANLHTKALAAWRDAMSAGFGKKNEEGSGFRNSQVTTCAPAGTVSFALGAATTGIEPEFSLKRTKTMIGGDVVTYVNPTIEKALIALGYDETARTDLLTFVNANGHFEGSKLKEEHLPVFDCSAQAKDRCLSVDAHIEMVAAIQPMISGGISKTFNMPSSATLKDVQFAFLKGWERGLKGLTIYRSGSKLSEPLRVKELIAARKKEHAAVREELPEDRQSFTHKYSLQGYTGYITVSFYPDGRVGEVWARMARPGSMVSGLLDGWAKGISYLLQYGVSLADIVRYYEGARFSPAGITSNPDIPFATSVIDYIARWLKQKYLSKDEQKAVDEHRNRKIVEATAGRPALETTEMDFDINVDPCPNCGSALIRTGTCSVCRICSFSSGTCS